MRNKPATTGTARSALTAVVAHRDACFECNPTKAAIALRGRPVIVAQTPTDSAAALAREAEAGNGEVVQRRQGVRFHCSGRRREGRLRTRLRA
jgi:hypothetical protein